MQGHVRIFGRVRLKGEWGTTPRDLPIASDFV